MSKIIRNQTFLVGCSALLFILWFSTNATSAIDIHMFIVQLAPDKKVQVGNDKENAFSFLIHQGVFYDLFDCP